MIPIVSGGAILIILLSLLGIAAATISAPTIAFLLLIRGTDGRSGMAWAVTRWKPSSILVTTIAVDTLILLPAYAAGEKLAYRLFEYPDFVWHLALTIAIAIPASIVSMILLGIILWTSDERLEV
jgi:hypothetical protein